MGSRSSRTTNPATAISFDEELMDGLRRAARSQRRSLADVLEEAARNYLEELDDARVVAARRKEKPVPWNSVKRRLGLDS